LSADLAAKAGGDPRFVHVYGALGVLDCVYDVAKLHEVLCAIQSSGLGLRYRCIPPPRPRPAFGIPQDRPNQTLLFSHLRLRKRIVSVTKDLPRRIPYFDGVTL